ncbi:MAG TPA: helix-turn-helix transcriptional regulator [Phycisphaerales bacterium]|nr:helix-turn-helix transcriptional regulator [Phycisphaerales bacterium]
MQDAGHTLTVDHVALAAELAASCCTLPAIATVEWCDDAARILCGVRPGAIAMTAVVQFAADGAVSAIEASGCAGFDTNGNPIRGEALLPLHAPRLDWAVGELGGGNGTSWPRAARVRDLSAGASFGETDSGRRWSRFGATDHLVGAAPMPGNVPGRMFIAQVGIPTTKGTWDRGDAAVMAATMKPLVNRAAMAFGRDVTSALNRLTQREREVLDHLAIGKSVKEIAADLARSPHTVHDHVKSLHRKLKASSRGELIARALGHIGPTGPEGSRLAVHTTPDASPTIISVGRAISSRN